MTEFLTDSAGRIYYQCDNCDAIAREDGDDIREARDLHERLDPGGIYTDKECGHCGALVYPVIKSVPATDRDLARMEFVGEASELVMSFIDRMAGYGIDVVTHDGHRFTGFIGPHGATQRDDEDEPHFDLTNESAITTPASGIDIIRRLPLYGTRIIAQ